MPSLPWLHDSGGERPKLRPWRAQPVRADRAGRRQRQRVRPQQRRVLQRQRVRPQPWRVLQRRRVTRVADCRTSVTTRWASMQTVAATRGCER